MGHIRRRNRPKPWEARVFIDGRWATKSFARKVDAERWMTEQESKILRGEWVDPRAPTAAAGRSTRSPNTSE